MSSICVLCAEDGGTLVWRNPQLRVIRADEPGFPAFYRVIWQAHTTEFTDLAAASRQHCMEAVAVVEQALRDHLQPVKVNLASLGNQVAHLHWHVIARFAWDSHYPGAVWAQTLRSTLPEPAAAVRALLPALERDLVQRLGQALPHV